MTSLAGIAIVMGLKQALLIVCPSLLYSAIVTGLLTSTAHNYYFFISVVAHLHQQTIIDYL
jgi:hypothetical protein